MNTGWGGLGSDQAELGHFISGRQLDLEAATSMVGTVRTRRDPHIEATGAKVPGLVQGEGAGPGLDLSLMLYRPPLLGTRHLAFPVPLPDPMLTKHLLGTWLCKRLSPETRSPVRCTRQAIGAQSSHCKLIY